MTKKLVLLLKLHGQVLFLAPLKRTLSSVMYAILSEVPKFTLNFKFLSCSASEILELYRDKQNVPTADRAIQT